MRVAIMQPYFIPYAGYFRLLAATDLFVVYDCVQFPRRGWVHRNQLTRHDGAKDWLTLPLAKAPQQVRIDALRFAEGAQERWNEALVRFRVFDKGRELVEAVAELEGTPLEYIVALLKECAYALGLPFNIVHSSSLGIPEDVHAQDRILAICRAVKAKHYVNAPGGRALYDEETFMKAGVELRFLPEYRGNHVSILERLVLEDQGAVRQEIVSQL